MRKRLRNRLSNVLSCDEATCAFSSHDVVGDIAIVRPMEESARVGREIGEAVVDVHRNVRTVFAQSGGVGGEFRVRRLEHVAGERKSITVHKESGCMFWVDVERCFFSPRLSHERLRIADQTCGEEVVLNMFAGVGCFSVVVVKHVDVERVFSIDLDPVAVEFMRTNVRVNGFYGKVIPVFRDAKDVIIDRLRGTADRVLMPLPEKALHYLPYALLALKGNGGWVHYYDFTHAGKGEDPVDKVEQKVSERLGSLGVTFEVKVGRVVRSTGPFWYQVVLDIKVS